MVTKPSDCQLFFIKKEYIQSKTFPLNKGSNWLFKHILCNQHVIINIIFKFTNELSQFMLPWQPKHHTIRDFTKNGIFNKKGILDANYLLSAGQNTNNFQHILHNQYLLYKYTNNTFKDSRLELPWQQLQEMPQKLLLYGQKYDKYWDLPN